MNWIHNLRRRLLRQERGVALVEFALVAPVLFLVLFGLLDFGKAINYWNTETQMAAQAARIAAVNGDNTYTGACVGGGTKATLTDYIQCQSSTGELRNGSSGTFGATAAQVCIIPLPPSGGAAAGDVGQAIRVTAKTNYSWIPLLGVAPISITGTATMRIERKWTAGTVHTAGASC
jgi:Flp pilus assembly protein TadG